MFFYALVLGETGPTPIAGGAAQYANFALALALAATLRAPLSKSAVPPSASRRTLLTKRNACKHPECILGHTVSSTSSGEVRQTNEATADFTQRHRLEPTSPQYGFVVDYPG